MPFITSIKQQPNANYHTNFAQLMDNSITEQGTTTNGSPSPINAFSLSNNLRPTPKQSAPEREDQLPKPLEDIFNTQFIAAMTNRDTVLREVRHCVPIGDNQRCKKLSKQMFTHWSNLSVHNSCILLENKLTIPNALKESVFDLLHFTHPGAWLMTELTQHLWWPFINRDLINKSKTFRPCTEFDKNFKKCIILKNQGHPYHHAQNKMKKYN